jgi:hypothetical protein
MQSFKVVPPSLVHQLFIAVTCAQLFIAVPPSCGCIRSKWFHHVTCASVHSGSTFMWMHLFKAVPHSHVHQFFIAVPPSHVGYAIVQSGSTLTCTQLFVATFTCMQLLKVVPPSHLPYCSWRFHLHMDAIVQSGFAFTCAPIIHSCSAFMGMQSFKVVQPSHFHNLLIAVLPSCG